MVDDDEVGLDIVVCSLEMKGVSLHPKVSRLDDDGQLRCGARRYVLSLGKQGADEGQTADAALIDDCSAFVCRRREQTYVRCDGQLTECRVTANRESQRLASAVTSMYIIVNHTSDLPLARYAGAAYASARSVGVLASKDEHGNTKEE